MSEMATRVVARFAAAAVGEVKKGDDLKVLSRRGQWPRDMYAKGTTMVVIEGGKIGDLIKTKPKGDVMTSGHEFKLLKAPKGAFKLDSTNDTFKRSLKVQPV